MKSNVLLAQHESGETRVFDTLFDASLALKISAGNISRCLAGDRQTAGGYRWFRVKRILLVVEKYRGGKYICSVNGKSLVDVNEFKVIQPLVMTDITAQFYDIQTRTKELNPKFMEEE